MVQEVQLAKRNNPDTLVLISAYGVVGKERMHPFAQRVRGSMHSLSSTVYALMMMSV